ncbi:unnamed protein product [Paramecium octaurelia]|uniref:PH domain-containing protein n=1 Tax=Paramecium octaurelia TaxID=43137 RepID=A0A8S1Y248_PAROT|nr:unnamed protein product [Paramecium octaurelia]
MDLRSTVYLPSKQISEGEIQVKGKTLGRWKTKKFIIDEDQRIFALKSSQAKKKLKPFYLQYYKLDIREKKKDKISFDLISKAGGKSVTLGIQNEQQANLIINLLQKLITKEEPIQKQSQEESLLKSQIEQPMENTQNLAYEKIDYEIPCFFDTSEIRENISQIRRGQQRLEKFQVVQKEQAFTIYKNVDNHHQFVTFIEFVGDCCDLIVQNLSDNNKINQWNPYVSQTESMVVKELAEDKSFQICEIRQLTNLFVFKREFQYLRHHLKIDNIDFIVQKQIDQRPKTKCYQGSLKYGLWSIQYKNNVTKVCYATEQSLQGLSYPDEDSYLIQMFLQQIQNINKQYVQKTIKQDPPINSVEIPQINKAIIQEQQVQGGEPQIQKQQPDQQQLPPQIKVVQQSQKQNQEEDDQFFDCEEEDAIDEMNDKLFIVETVDNKQLIQDEVVKDVYEQNARRQSILPIQIDTQDNNEQDWVDKKMKLVLSGGYCSLSINVKHQLQPKEKGQNRQFLTSQEGGHYIFKKDFIREEKNGGLKVINEEKLAAQKAVIKFLITRIGASLLMGKSITGISMPVSIFEARSNTERVCSSLGFAPIYLEEAALSQDIYYRIKQCAAFQFGFIFMYISCEKPFNPILGETFQGFYDNCPIYCEQISHHPPICAIQLYGRSYKIEGQLELVANFHSNSVVGRNVGTFKITFENPHQEILLTFAPGSLNGTTYGDKVLNYLEKQFIIDLKNKIILETTFNPDKKYCQYFEVEYVNQLDYLCGAICDVTDTAILRYQKEGFRKYKGLDLKNDVKQVKHKIKGIWINEIKVDNQKLISIQHDYPVKMQLAQFPIPSDATFRMDLLWWKLRNFDQSQQWKEKLEILQRQDRKLREQKSKKKK